MLYFIGFLLLIGWVGYCFYENINPKSSISKKEVLKQYPNFFKDFDKVYKSPFKK